VVPELQGTLQRSSVGKEGVIEIFEVVLVLVAAMIQAMMTTGVAQ